MNVQNTLLPFSLKQLVVLLVIALAMMVTGIGYLKLHFANQLIRKEITSLTTKIAQLQEEMLQLELAIASEKAPGHLISKLHEHNILLIHPSMNQIIRIEEPE